MNFDAFFNGFWFYSILAGWSTWQWVFLNFSQNFWSFDTPDTPGCASAVIWNRFEPFLLQWSVFFTHDEGVSDLSATGLYRCSQPFPESSISIMHSFAGNHIIFKGIFMTTSHYSSHPLPAYLPRPLLSYMALSTWSSLKHTDLEPQKVPSMKNTPKKEILCRYILCWLIYKKLLHYKALGLQSNIKLFIIFLS